MMRLRINVSLTESVHLPCLPAQLALPLSSLGSKSEKDLAGMKRNKSAVRFEEDESTVVVDVTRLHRKEVSAYAASLLASLAVAATAACCLNRFGAAAFWAGPWLDKVALQGCCKACGAFAKQQCCHS